VITLERFLRETSPARRDRFCLGRLFQPAARPEPARRALARLAAQHAVQAPVYSLEYLVHKVERHSGERIVLSQRERCLPLLLLWPKFFRYLRRRRAAEAGR
jgi:hypothetical protein